PGSPNSKLLVLLSFTNSNTIFNSTLQLTEGVLFILVFTATAAFVIVFIYWPAFCFWLAGDFSFFSPPIRGNNNKEI
ncbi:MAG: hypothetical protein OCD00_19485, partial [Colwellia sp.]